MTDLDILQDLFMVDHVAQRMGWPVSAHLCAETVRALQAAARKADSHPDDVMAAINKLRSAIGDTNITAVIAHDLWDEWCPQRQGRRPFALQQRSRCRCVGWHAGLCEML
jgi:hypothetical protein